MRFPVSPRTTLSVALIVGVVIALASESRSVGAQSLPPIPTPAPPPAATGGAVQRTISVTGASTVMLAPDLAMFSAGVTDLNADSTTAQNTVNTTTNAIIDALRQNGVDVTKDVQTSGYSIQPQYNYPQNGVPMLTGYRVTNSVDVTVRDINKVGQLLGAVAQAGANQVGSVSFSLANPEAASNMARTQAVQNARARANVLAMASNVSVGAVLTIDDETSTPSPPMPRAASVTAASAGGAAAPPPIQTGETSVTATVRVTYSIA